MAISTIILGSLFVINILFACTIVFLERQNASATWAWLMVLVFIPIAGFILYFIFNQNFTKRKMFNWDEEKKTGVKKQAL